jgi:hypothetical protein
MVRIRALEITAELASTVSADEVISKIYQPLRAFSLGTAGWQVRYSFIEALAGLTPLLTPKLQA